MDTIEALQCPVPVQEMSKMNVGDEVGRDNEDNVSSPSRVKRTNKSANVNENDEQSKTPVSPVRRVERNKSGPLCRMMKGSRAPPKRSQSSKIGRPMFDPTLGDTDQQHNTRRGVNRTHSSRVKGTTRNPPARSGSFQRRRVPDRTNSSSSLRRSNNKSMTTGTLETDDVSVTDSVYTSISIQTMDSIMIRKKQIPLHNGKDADGGGMSIEFDGSGNWIEQGNDEGEVHEDEFSVFSDSWSSDESCEVLSDYEEGEMDGAILEDEEHADEN